MLGSTTVSVSMYLKLISHKIIFEISNLSDHGTWTSQTDRQTDRHTDRHGSCKWDRL